MVAQVVIHIITAQLLRELVVREARYKTLAQLEEMQMLAVKLVQMVELRVQLEQQMVRLVQLCRAIQEKLINGVYHGR